VAKLVARLLAKAALSVRIQASLKNTKWVTTAKKGPTAKKIIVSTAIKQSKEKICGRL
jgi:hypothetical protein